MRRRRVLALLAGLPLSASLGACGFRPMYARLTDGAPSPVQRELAAITVGIIPDRPGQVLREALQARLERDAAGIARRYDLAVAYEIEGEGIAIQRDNTISRIRLTGRAQWTLRAQDAQRSVLASGTARSVDAVNVLREQYFAADLGNEAAQRRIAQQVAEQITLQLAAYFSRQATPRPA
jgi:LPS-assembly lipoprotein